MKEGMSHVTIFWGLICRSQNVLLVISTGLWKLYLDLIPCQDNTTRFLFPKGIWYFFLDPHVLCYSESYICLQLWLRLTHCCHISKQISLRLENIDVVKFYMSFADYPFMEWMLSMVVLAFTASSHHRDPSIFVPADLDSLLFYINWVLEEMCTKVEGWQGGQGAPTAIV